MLSDPQGRLEPLTCNDLHSDSQPTRCSTEQIDAGSIVITFLGEAETQKHA
jgi:hypothetical protein